MKELGEVGLAMATAAGWILALLGAALIIAPRSVMNLSSYGGAYDPLLRVVGWLERGHYIERYVYRRHRAFGAFITLGALYSSFILSGTDVSRLLAEPASWALSGATRFLWLANTALIFVGITIFARPSALKGLEKWANHSVNVRTTGAWLRETPRLAGSMLLVIGLYLLSMIIVV